MLRYLKINFGVICLSLISAVNTGVAIRFWVALFTPRQEYIIDYTPVVYWGIGVFLTLLLFSLIASIHDRFPPYGKTVLLSLNYLFITGYLGVVVLLLYRMMSK